nr:MAG: hypothetical protein J07AB56_02050 [Candidatus Nanosalinarum sp. J07AB56]
MILAAVIASSAGGSAEVFHDLDASRNEAVLNTTIELESDSPINRWSLTWSVPEGSEVVRVRDSAGPSDYDRVGDTLEITTNSGPARQTETVRVVSRLGTEADGIHAGLWERRLSLPGLEGENTSGVVEAENLISWKTGYGFRSAQTGNGFSFRGTGPVTLSFKAGNGNTTRHFQFFGREARGAEDAFGVAAGTTGLRPRFDRFPVATLPGAKYNRTVNEWSQGEYVNGRIRIRQGLEEDFVPVLAHEVVHGLNDRKLTWDRTRSTYFDEGMASHIENLLRRAKQSESSGAPAGELFGDTSTYDPDTEDQRFLRVPPRGEADRLWEYYENNLSFMEMWSAQDSRNRRFGYAYSELVIKKHVADGGSLKELYENLDPGREITDPSAKWEFFSEHVDMKPCKLSSREEFNACLNRVRSHEYGFSRAVPEPGDGSLKVEEVQLPDRTEQRTYVERGSRNTNRSQGSSAAVSALGDLFNRLFSWV